MALSITELEYIALTEAIKEAIWLKGFVEKLEEKKLKKLKTKVMWNLTPHFNLKLYKVSL